MRQSQILIIDGNNFAYRSLVLDTMRTEPGVRTEVLYMMLGSIVRLLKKFNTHKFIISWDISKSIKRKKLYPQYKANRKNKTPEEESKYNIFLKQLKLTQKVFEFMKLPQAMVPRIESDDTISLLAYLLGGVGVDGRHAVIVSSDKDLLQCITDKISVYNPMKKQLISIKAFRRKYDMTPQQYNLCRLMIGDSSDNIKGIAGVGEKTAFRIIHELQPTTLISIFLHYANDINIKSKIDKRIQNSFELLKLNEKLMKLPIRLYDLDIEEKDCFMDVVNKQLIKSIYTSRSVNKIKLKRLWFKLEMSTFINELNELCEWLNIKLV